MVFQQDSLNNLGLTSIPVIFSERSTEVNNSFVGRGDALSTGGTYEGICGVGEVTVGNATTLMDESQNFPKPEIFDVITEQHQGGTQDTGTGTNLAESSWHLGVM